MLFSWRFLWTKRVRKSSGKATPKAKDRVKSTGAVNGRKDLTASMSINEKLLVRITTMNPNIAGASNAT